MFAEAGNMECVVAMSPQRYQPKLPRRPTYVHYWFKDNKGKGLALGVHIYQQVQSKKNTKRNIFNHTKEEPIAQSIEQHMKKRDMLYWEHLYLYYGNGGPRHPTKVAAPNATKKHGETPVGKDLELRIIAPLNP